RRGWNRRRIGNREKHDLRSRGSSLGQRDVGLATRVCDLAEQRGRILALSRAEPNLAARSGESTTEGSADAAGTNDCNGCRVAHARMLAGRKMLNPACRGRAGGE